MAKEFLSQHGVSFKEYDVNRDQDAAMRMVRISGQRGVPVVTIDDSVVVGFDRERLRQLVSQEARAAPQLGASVADAPKRLDVEGAYVGRVRSGSPAEAAGLKPGDVVTELAGHPVRNAADLENVLASLESPAQVTFTYIRQGRPYRTNLNLCLPGALGARDKTSAWEDWQ